MKGSLRVEPKVKGSPPARRLQGVLAYGLAVAAAIGAGLLFRAGAEGQGPGKVVR